VSRKELGVAQARRDLPPCPNRLVAKLVLRSNLLNTKGSNNLRGGNFCWHVACSWLGELQMAWDFTGEQVTRRRVMKAHHSIHTIHIRSLLLLAAAVLLLPTGRLMAKDSYIRWIIQAGFEATQIDKSQIERLYDEACQFLEDRFGGEGRVIRPHLIIHVGEKCPDAEIEESCLSIASGEVFLPKWDEYAPGVITNAVLMMGMQQLLDHDELHMAVLQILKNDTKNFLDARAVQRN